MAQKSKYWTGVLYPENMVSTWKEDIGEILQLPYCYCVHNKDNLVGDKKEERKEHVHLMVAFPNTTTYNHALTVFRGLGLNSCNKIESVINVKYLYDYLIHDTEDAKKKNKYQYDVSERICGNNFDIGAFEQLSSKEKDDIARELCSIIINQRFTNFVDFYCYVISNCDSAAFEVIKTHSGLFERLTKGNFQKFRCD